MTKVCSKCKIEKSLLDFHKRPERASGVRSKCKSCEQLIATSRVKGLDREAYNKKQREYNANHRATINAAAKKYRDDNVEKLKEWRKINSKQRQLNRKIFESKFKEQHGYSYDTHLRNTNTFVKLKKQLRNRLNDALKYKTWTKTTKFYDYIGCDKDTFMAHIKSLFLEGMTWENYGLFGWHLDHKIPLSSAKSEEEMTHLCHYTNIQPLWAAENIKKSNKII